jgi:hypothetical protein
MSPTSTVLPGSPTTSADISSALAGLSERYREQPVPLGDILDTLGSRASALLVVICALPFSTPISLPGLSTPFGLVILLLAARYLVGLPPWLPARLRRVVLPGAFFTRVLTAGGKLVGWLERRLSARWHLIADAEWKRRFHTCVVMISAMMLMLPLPPLPPFTNTLPALVAVVMTFSVLKRDGAGIVGGYLIFGFTIGYYIFWGAVIVEAVERYGGKMLNVLGWGI